MAAVSDASESRAAPASAPALPSPPARLTDIPGSVHDLIGAFNERIVWLRNLLRVLFSGDMTVERACRQITITVTHVPTAALDIVGPYLVKYSDQILSRDVGSVLKKDYSSLIAGPEAPPDSGAALTRDILPTIVAHARDSENSSLLAAVFDAAEDMLDVYLEYVDK